MALRHHFTELKGKGKYLLENARSKIRQYRLTRGSGRTEEIFGMHWTTKLFITLLILILLTGVFYAGKMLLKKESSPIVNDAEETIVETAQEVAANHAPVVDEEVMPIAEEPLEPASAPSIDEEKEQLREEIRQLRRQKESLSPLLVDKDELAEAAPVTVLPEPFDVQNMRAACQVDIRDKENDLAGASQFFKEANRSYAIVLEQVREPADTLREAVEKLKVARAELDAKISACVADAPEEQEPELPEETPEEQEPSSNTSSENQTDTP